MSILSDMVLQGHRELQWLDGSTIRFDKKAKVFACVFSSHAKDQQAQNGGFEATFDGIASVTHAQLAGYVPHTGLLCRVDDFQSYRIARTERDSVGFTLYLRTHNDKGRTQ